MAKATAATLICLFAVSFVCAQDATTTKATPEATVKPTAGPVPATAGPVPATAGPVPAPTGAPEKATEKTLNLTSSSPIPGSGEQAVEKNGSTFVLASTLLIALSVVLCMSN